MTTTADLVTHRGRFGPFTVIADGDVVIAAGWDTDCDTLLARIHPALRPTAIRARTDLGPITAALRAYDDGDHQAIDGIAVHQHSGPFHGRVRAELRSIPHGRTLSYAELAAASGRPGAARAAGSACARNVIALFVPCHRAIGSDGTLRGFAYGLAHKSALLAHEVGTPSS